MRRAGYDIGRDQVARLMRAAGIRGVVRGRKPVTTRPAETPDVRPDLVQRNFCAPAPNRLWVADITYVPTRSGFVYTAFVTDVYSRKIVGWATQSRLTTEALPLEALNQAIAAAKGSLKDLVHHSDQLWRVCQQLNIAQSVGRTGVCFDCQSGGVQFCEDWEVLADWF